MKGIMVYWKKKKAVPQVLTMAGLTILMVSMVKSEREKALAEGCRPPPLFVLGASMLDVGENEAAMPGREASEFPPYGLHYFGHPAARFSNGRLLIDFISQGLGYGLVDPYLRSVGSNFKHGVNFASSGATIRNSTASADGSNSGGLFSLSVQIDQFRFFKAASLAFNNAEGFGKTRLTIEEFVEGVYIIEIGHNDYLQHAVRNPDYNSDTFVAETILLMKEALLRLYNEGARKLVVLNMLPLGCMPGVLGFFKPPKEFQDEYGCSISFNNLTSLHNKHLNILLKDLHQQLPNANWILFDIHGVIWNAIRHPALYVIVMCLVLLLHQMVKVSSAKFEVEKFNGKKNFELWKLKARDVLVQQGLHKALDGKAKKHVGMDDDDWEELDTKALSAIWLCLADEVLFNIAGEKTVAGLWTKLKSLYMTKSVTNRILPEEAVVYIADERSTSDDLDYDSVVGAFLAKEMRRKSTRDNSTPEAMFARGISKERGQNSRGTSRSKSQGGKSKARCWHCGKAGHLKKDCGKRKESEKKEDVTKEANQVETSEGMTDEVLSVCNVSSYHHEWLLDSGATHHMCPHRGWFSSYQPLDGSSVLLGNNVSCKT
ncbi:hypothetical protein KI387_012862 [Taxus chinensis]|uniref:CCHC-type domain-containing protein n=1 Tax=Taxus chinensis TaxID=29808 RepID=A0AA38CQD9_TAXCH|nr:hypothetical protein KI387_012862 [Taxus chinensis]